VDIFDPILIKLDRVTCHSGGAIGSDSYFENFGSEYGVITKAYSYKTKNHVSPNKVEISDIDYKEGMLEVQKANKWLNRYGINKYMNLLARNWAQVKYSKQIIAIGHIIKPKERGSKGYYNQGKYDVLDGGTAYAVTMGINHNRTINVFDQKRDKWYRWSYTTMSFIEMDSVPMIESYDFAGIGTREIKSNGIKAIRDVYEITKNNGK
jgi:hypothetical protein